MMRLGTKRKLIYKLSSVFALESPYAEYSDIKGVVVSGLALVLAVLLIFSFALYRHKKQAQTQLNPQDEVMRLAEELEKVKAENERLQKENRNLQQQFNATRNNAVMLLTHDSPAIESMLKAYQAALFMAGMEDYLGPGMYVTIEDKEGLGANTKAEEIVHDADVRYIVEWFKRHYAYALAINGERLSPMSPILCLGPSILVNRVYQSSPFVVEIGCDTTKLFEAFDQDAGIQQMRKRGLRIKIERVDEMKILAQQDRVYINSQVQKLETIK